MDAENKPPRLSSLRVGTENFGFAKSTERLADDIERRLLELFFAEKRKEIQTEDLVEIKYVTLSLTTDGVKERAILNF